MLLDQRFGRDDCVCTQRKAMDRGCKLRLKVGEQRVGSSCRDSSCDTRNRYLGLESRKMKKTSLYWAGFLPDCVWTISLCSRRVLVSMCCFTVEAEGATVTRFL